LYGIKERKTRDRKILWKKPETNPPIAVTKIKKKNHKTKVARNFLTGKKKKVKKRGGGRGGEKGHDPS